MEHTFINLAKQRYSCRTYQDVIPEDSLIEQVLEAGRIAPSAVNFQPWRFYVVRKPEMIKKAHEVYHRDWINSAPCIIFICVDHTISWKRNTDGKDFADVDAAIAIDHMTLQATDIGLATCWVCNFYVDKAREMLKLPEPIEPIAMLPLGYAKDKTKANRHESGRKSLNDIAIWS